MSTSVEECFVDTNIIIESHRCGCWNALKNGAPLTTVDEVIRECATGGCRQKDYVTIDITDLQKHLRYLPVSRQELVHLRLRLAGHVNLDAGEEHLLAKAIGASGNWSICSPDGALVRACWVLGVASHIVSLEYLLRSAGGSPQLPLQYQYTEKWLSGRRTDLALEFL